MPKKIGEISIFVHKGEFKARCIRSAVFSKGDDLTIVLETNETGNRELIINLGSLTNKPFRMLCHNIGGSERPDKLLPELTPVKVENGIIKENLSKKHAMYLFTTL